MMGKRHRQIRKRSVRAAGGVLVEVSIAMGLAAVVGLLVMRASLLAVSNNQWTIMQTLTDAFLTRETALSNRVPVAALTDVDSAWPDRGSDDPPMKQQVVELGRLAGGTPVSATLSRFRINQTPAGPADAPVDVWRLYSVLSYEVGGKQYFKTRTTLRTQ